MELRDAKEEIKPKRLGSAEIKGDSFGGRGDPAQEQTGEQQIQARPEEKEDPLISAWMRSGVGTVASHTDTPRQRDSLSRGLKGKGKARSADETFICLKNIARLKDTCNGNGSGP